MSTDKTDSASPALARPLDLGPITPTPGAASELLPCPFCGQEMEVLSEQVAQHPVPNLSRAGGRPFCILAGMSVSMHQAQFWNMRAAPPAPATEGAQREAVALVGYMHREDAEWLHGGSYREGKLRSYRRRYDDVALYTAPPPPDRVQTRNPESSIAQPERVETACSRCNGTGKIREESGSVYGGADIRKCPECSAPPTDASGGVTEDDIARIRALAEKAAPEAYWWKSGVPADAGAKMQFIAACDPQTIIALIEAADRARKQTPVATQPVDASAVDLEHMLRECVPGGSICDPQRVCDSIREYFETHATRAQAEGDTDE